MLSAMEGISLEHGRIFCLVVSFCLLLALDFLFVLNVGQGSSGMDVQFALEKYKWGLKMEPRVQIDGSYS